MTLQKLSKREVRCLDKVKEKENDEWGRRICLAPSVKPQKTHVVGTRYMMPHTHDGTRPQNQTWPKIIQWFNLSLVKI